ncbi:hypothetical protein D9611_004247 [Ephemerocybe angulata]|uniref:Uncharacterized protein n=1 Tax=Ephemerocybe angulata TaxID=980116 RepID=A0A8H5F5L9_9AGAR|nr:hypothetical protein D9611_004247 [Tulosesus angulatus]
MFYRDFSKLSFAGDYFEFLGKDRIKEKLNESTNLAPFNHVLHLVPEEKGVGYHATNHIRYLN